MNKSDRCDAPLCGAEAMVRVRKFAAVKDSPEADYRVVTLVLEFCSHHCREYQPALDAQGFFATPRDKEPEPA